MYFSVMRVKRSALACFIAYNVAVFFIVLRKYPYKILHKLNALSHRPPLLSQSLHIPIFTILHRVVSGVSEKNNILLVNKLPFLG